MNLGHRMRIVENQELAAENVRLHEEVDRLRALVTQLSEEGRAIDLVDQSEMLASA